MNIQVLNRIVIAIAITGLLLLAWGYRNATTNLGVYAVLGNHDQWRSATEAMAALRNVGIQVLDNDAAQAGPLVIGGVDDAFTGHDDVNATADAMTRLPGDKILLSHSPDVTPEVPRSVGLVVGGHTHCGQVALLLIGPIVTMSRFGRRYARSLFREKRPDADRHLRHWH